MPEAVPTIERLLLGAALKRLQVRSGKKAEDLAKAIGKDRARLSRVFDGKATLSVEELTTLLRLLGAEQQAQHELLALGARARERPGRRRYTDLVPRSYTRLPDLESMATEIRMYEPGVLPWPIQIPEYLEAMMTNGDGIWWESSWEERRRRINFRLERQRLVMEARPPKTMHLIITDVTLRTMIGGRETMQRQLEHLLRVIDERPEITVQVLSATEPHNPTQCAGIILLHLGDTLPQVGFLPVAYGPSTYVEAPRDIERLGRAFDRLSLLAKSREESHKMITSLAARR